MYIHHIVRAITGRCLQFKPQPNWSGGSQTVKPLPAIGILSASTRSSPWCLHNISARMNHWTTLAPWHSPFTHQSHGTRPSYMRYVLTYTTTCSRRADFELARITSPRETFIRDTSSHRNRRQMAVSTYMTHMRLNIMKLSIHQNRKRTNPTGPEPAALMYIPNTTVFFLDPSRFVGMGWKYQNKRIIPLRGGSRKTPRGGSRIEVVPPTYTQN